MVTVGRNFGKFFFLGSVRGCPVKIAILICVITVIADIMTTIMVRDEVKKDLLKYASELQLKLGHRVDYNEAIKHLLIERRKHPALLIEACKPIPGAEEARAELLAERRRDEPDP